MLSRIEIDAYLIGFDPCQPSGPGGSNGLPDVGGTAAVRDQDSPLGPVDPNVRNPLNELVATVSVWVTRSL